MKAAYDQKDPESIEAYGKRLVGGTLRSVQGVNPVPRATLDTTVGGRTRGSFGSALEAYYYGINPGNESEPDFKDAGVELKASPIKRLTRGGYSAKERLVFSLINYEKEAGKSFETSSFLHKSSKLMLVSYLHEKGEALGDHLVKIAKLIRFDDLPKKDKKIIQDDWNTIVTKIRAGKAHELSEGDTLYLGACTKGVNSKSMRPQHGTSLMAKPRAFSFKSGYMTSLVRRELAVAPDNQESAIKDVGELDGKSFEEVILSRFGKYIGKSVDAIAEEIGFDLNPAAKGYYAAIARRMLGVRKASVEELEKAEVVLKTIRLSASGSLEESMSFPAFKARELVNQEWEESDLHELLSKRFLFVTYQYNKDGILHFKSAKFWTMPLSILDGIVHDTWLQTIEKLKLSSTDGFVKKSEGKVVHIRPHGRNKLDTDMLPNGATMPKKCFWLNKDYIKSILEIQ